MSLIYFDRQHRAHFTPLDLLVLSTKWKRQTWIKDQLQLLVPWIENRKVVELNSGKWPIQTDALHLYTGSGSDRRTDDGQTDGRTEKGRGDDPGSETLPEDDLGAVLLVLLLADPRRGQGGQVGQRRPSPPHREDPVLRAADPDHLPRLGGHQSPDFSLEPLGEPRQQRVATFRETRSQVKSLKTRVEDSDEQLASLKGGGGARQYKANIKGRRFVTLEKGVCRDFTSSRCNDDATDDDWETEFPSG